jgi:hypothetical protein
MTVSDDMAAYLAGPFFLMKPTGELPAGVLTVSHCLATVAPDTWAIDWVSVTDTDRAEAAARCEIADERVSAAIEWATERFGVAIGWSHALLDLDAAREFRRLFLPPTFQLLQIGLPEGALSSFLALSAPPPQQPGYAPVGASGAYEAVVKKTVLSAGERRGHEVLGYDRYGGGFHSSRCHSFEQDLAALGASLNRWGLIDDAEAARRCAEYAGGKGTCADGWHPWLIVEHAL